jgi:hypothetical protein
MLNMFKVDTPVSEYTTEVISANYNDGICYKEFICEMRFSSI